MIPLLVASAGLVVGCAGYAWWTYARAVAHGRRVYSHVVLATSYVIAVEWVAVTSVAVGSAQSWVLLAANAGCVAAMLTVAGRFR